MLREALSRYRGPGCAPHLETPRRSGHAGSLVGKDANPQRWGHRSAPRSFLRLRFRNCSIYYLHRNRRSGEIGIRTRLKIWRGQTHVGSSPTSGTITPPCKINVISNSLTREWFAARLNRYLDYLNSFSTRESGRQADTIL